ncbi:hypothetical protein HK414_25295 [Ramlibacter terrae]|uniref:Transglycosylase SLT domain-containing protein n=1 Tax=Ramlibacter terrae TaxID=2732511 RepID=A0ABX6P7J1_9BURK|nr:hypothetical protein HK414_25295 [Ramlibacter terrae]
MALACMAAGVTGASFRAPAVMPVAAAPAGLEAAAAVAKPVMQAVVQAAAPAAAVVQSPAVRPAAAAIASPATQPALFAVLADAEPSPRYYEKLRAEVRWMAVRVGTRKLATPDPRSRLLLAQSAAELAELDEVGLDYRDVYGVINAETTWVPRAGMGKNGVTSHGLAQFEPGTAKAVGLSNPNDPIEAVHAAAVLLREAATWSSRRIAGLDLTPEMRAVKLREGVSIYYNLSSKARRQWSGGNTRAAGGDAAPHPQRAGGRRAGRSAARTHRRRADRLRDDAHQLRAGPVGGSRPRAGAARGGDARREAAAAGQDPHHRADARRQARRGGRPHRPQDWVLPQGTISWSKG